MKFHEFSSKTRMRESPTFVMVLEVSHLSCFKCKVKRWPHNGAFAGCGKSSQVPQILLRDVLKNKGVIACTQPRRIAASALATRVAHEMGVTLGEEVSLEIRAFCYPLLAVVKWR